MLAAVAGGRSTKFNNTTTSDGTMIQGFGRGCSDGPGGSGGGATLNLGTGDGSRSGGGTTNRGDPTQGGSGGHCTFNIYDYDNTVNCVGTAG